MDEQELDKPIGPWAALKALRKEVQESAPSGEVDPAAWDALRLLEAIVRENDRRDVEAAIRESLKPENCGQVRLSPEVVVVTSMTTLKRRG